MNLMQQYPQQRTGQSQLQDEFKQFVERFFNFGEGASDESSVVTSQWAPRVDIVEEPGRFVILADLPGVDPQDVEVLMDKGILSIRGERRSDIDQQNGRYSRIERRYGMFHRRFALPDSAAFPSARRPRRAASRSATVGPSRATTGPRGSRPAAIRGPPHGRAHGAVRVVKLH
jgi:HSP20 family protein